MKKVLVIMHDFPGNGGTPRFKIIKYLSHYGYQPIVITHRKKSPPWENEIIESELGPDFEVHRTFCINKTPFRIFSKLFGSWETAVFFEKLFFLPDVQVNWVPSAVWRALQIIDREDIAAVITASPEESTHLAGLIVKHYRPIKWVTYFADLWTTKEMVYQPATPIHDKIIRRMERAIYNQCDHIIANTQGNRKVYLNEFKLPEEKISVITGGFDPVEFEEPEIGRPSNGTLNIGYMGKFDKKGFPWQEFLKIMEAAMQEKIKIKLNVCGHIGPGAQAYVDQLGLTEQVNFLGNRSHQEAMKLTRQNDLLLVLHYETGYSKAIVPHKLYYYLGMNKPVLAIAEEDGETGDIIRRTGAGWIGSITHPERITNKIIQFHQEWKATGKIKYDPIPEIIEEYNVAKNTGILAEVIDRF